MKIVKNKIKNELPKDIRVSPEFYEKLDEIISWKIKKAVERAEANKRKTLRAHDL